MGLRVYKGDATKAYENKFFLSLKRAMKQLFDERGWNGVLIGFPVTDNDKFKPDCILANENKIVIIELKKYGGKIVFPTDRFDFENKAWKSDQVEIMEDRTWANPYKQVKWHRNKLLELVNVDAKNVQLCVCFHGQNGEIVNEVNDFYNGWCDVACRDDFVEKLDALLGVEHCYSGYDNGFDPVELVKVFRATEYRSANEFISNIDEEDRARSEKITKELDEAEEYKKQQQNLFKKAERELSEAKRMGRDVAEREKELKERERVLAQANKSLEEKQIEFENSEYKIGKDIEKAELELEKEKVVSRKETTIAKETTKTAIAKADAEKTKQKTTRIRIGAFAFFVIALIAGLVGYSAYTSNQRAAQLEYDRLNGNVCIPDEEVSKYEGAKSVCVEYHVGYVGKSDKLVFLNNRYRGDFAGVVKNTKKLPYDDAKAKYLNKNIEVWGDIIKYGNTYEIEIYDENRIKIKE